MSDHFNYDVDDLLAPISLEHPSGESLRYDPLYDEIQELRREDDATLPQGVWKRELKRADWNQVASLCIEALERKSKDLQIAGWLAEAWSFQHGFSGLEQGLRVLIGLCRDFWDDVHPQIDDDLSLRMTPLEWVDLKLPIAVKSIPVTRPETDDAPAYGWHGWESGQHLLQLARSDREAAEKAEEQGRPNHAKFLVSVTLTPSSFFQKNTAELASAREAFAELVGVVEQKAEGDAIHFSKLRDCLDRIDHFFKKTLSERAEDGESPVTAEGGESVMSRSLDEDDGQEDTPLLSPARITNRAEAYRRLDEASEYLLRTEPHSPTAYLVKRAVSWGNLTLAELLEELLAQNADLGTIYRLLGIRGGG